MNFYKLYTIVHNLSSSERTKFKQYVGGNPQRHDLLLFKRILANSVPSRKIETRIRGTEFSVDSKYSVYKKKLARLVIESLLGSEKKIIDPFTIARKSVERNAIEIGVDALNQEIRKANQGEDFARIRFIHDFIGNLEREFRIDFTLPQTVVSYSEITDLDESMRIVHEINSTIKKSFSMPYASRRLLAKGLSDRLKLIQPETVSLKSYIYKGFSGCSMLTEDSERAYLFGRKHFAIMESRPDLFGKTQLAYQLWFLAAAAMRVGDRNAAYRYVMQLFNINAGCQIEKEKILQVRIRTAIWVGEYLAKLEMIEEVLPEFWKNKDDFSENWKEKLVFKAALTYFYFEKYHEAIVLLDRIKRSPNSKLNWERHLLVAMCSFETGDFNRLESSIRKSQEAVSAQDTKYPQFALGALRELYRSPISRQAEILSSSIAQIEKLMKNLDEFRSAHFFQVLYWLKAKKNSVPPYQIIVALEENDNNTLSHSASN